jgi:glycosyltransferase involved in cell wall biosynthesis
MLATTLADPLVSVIIPSYNHAAYLRECVDSVLAQDYPNIEVIVVDDGSTDASVDILRAYGDRIILLHQARGRQARARNLGLSVAKGELVAFLDSDDRYLPRRIASAVEALCASPEVDVVWGDYRLVDASGAVVSEARWAASAGDFRRELIAGNPICNATVTLRRHVLDDIGGFDERAPRVCDGAAWYQIAARGHRFLHLDCLVLDYRLHDGNDSSPFAPMTRDRDTALVAAAQAYVRFGIVSTPLDKSWLCSALVRQFSFRAAAWVQRERSRGVTSELRARLYELMGSDIGLRLLAWLRWFKNALPRQGRS